MSEHERVTEEQLNAFLDGQLDARERQHVLEAVQNDEALARRLHELRLLMDEMSLAYHKPPGMERTPATSSRHASRLGLGVSAAALFLMGLFGAWFGQAMMQDGRPNSIRDIAGINTATSVPDKLIVHINAMDKSRIEKVLQTTETLLKANATREHPLRVEVIANAEGLGMLRRGSPYAKRIHAIAQSDEHVRFLACGIAMEAARLKEGEEIALIPEAHKVDAALEQILRRLKQGWTYVKG